MTRSPCFLCFFKLTANPYPVLALASTQFYLAIAKTPARKLSEISFFAGVN